MSQHKVTQSRPKAPGFTLVELVSLLAVLGLCLTMMAVGLAISNPNNSAMRCINNLKQLTAAWTMYAHDFNEILPTCANGIAGRTNWIGGSLDYFGSPSNTSTNTDMVKSPIWPYVGRDPSLFKCPADKSTVVVSGIRTARIRSYSMSHVFAKGEWLDKSYNPNQTVWRTYAKTTEIVIPAKTFVFAEEHPDSIGDSALFVACTGAQPQDPPGAAWIIDFPASYHSGAGGFSFADGRIEIHKWQSSKLKAPVSYTGTLPLNVAAGSGEVDIRWLAANTTVRR